MIPLQASQLQKGSFVLVYASVFGRGDIETVRCTVDEVYVKSGVSIFVTPVGAYSPKWVEPSQIFMVVM